MMIHRNIFGQKGSPQKQNGVRVKNAMSQPSLSSDALVNVISRALGVSRDKVMNSPAARKAFVNAANDLAGREVMAIMLRAVGMSYRAAGKVMGVSGDRVRYNEAKGLRKLRHPDKALFMQKYVRRNICDTIFPASKIQVATHLTDYAKIWPMPSGQRPFLRNGTQ